MYLPKHGRRSRLDWCHAESEYKLWINWVRWIYPNSKQKNTINLNDLQILNIQIHHITDAGWMKGGFPYSWRKACVYNLGQNIWNRIKKFSKIGRKQKTLITASAQLYYKRFISGRKTAGSISNQLLRFRSVKSFNNTLDNAVLFFYVRYQVPLYFWWMKTVLKCCKLQKYYVQDCTSFTEILWVLMENNGSSNILNLKLELKRNKKSLIKDISKCSTLVFRISDIKALRLISEHELWLIQKIRNTRRLNINIF